MKNYLVRILFPFLFLFLVTFTSARAQLSDKVLVHAGGLLQFVSLKDSFSNSAVPSYFGLGIGANYFGFQSNDVYSLAIEPNLHFAFSYNSLVGVSLLLQLPVYAKIRIGALSTPYNEQRFGIGAGLGGNFTYVNDNAVFQFVKINTTFLAPSALLEGIYNGDSRSYIIRVNWNLLDIRRNVVYDDLGQRFEYPFQFSTFGVSIASTL